MRAVSRVKLDTILCRSDYLLGEDSRRARLFRTRYRRHHGCIERAIVRLGGRGRRYPHLLSRMQIIRREAGDVAKAVPVREPDVTPASLDQPGGVERLEHPVDMDRGQSGRLPDLLLRHRQFIAVIGGATGGVAAHRELAQEMRDAAQAVARADIDHPFARDRVADRLMDPQSLRDRRAARGDLSHYRQGNGRDVHGGQRARVVIHRPQVEMLEPDTIPGDCQRDDLRLSLAIILLTVAISVEHDRQGIAPVALPHQIARGWIGLPRERQLEQVIPVVLI